MHSNRKDSNWETKQANLFSILHLPKKRSQEPELGENCDKGNLSVYSGLSLIFITNKFKLNIDENFENSKGIAFPEAELLHSNSKEGWTNGMPSTLLNRVHDCEEEDASGGSISVAFQAAPEQRKPLTSVFPSIPTPGPWNILTSHLLSFI